MVLTLRTDPFLVGRLVYMIHKLQAAELMLPRSVMLRLLGT